MLGHLSRTGMLKFFSYISTAKVNQLYDQITSFSIDKKTVKHSRGGEASAEVGSNAFFGFLRGTFLAKGQYNQDIEEEGKETTIQKLKKVTDHIAKYEKVLDLAELCKKREDVPLDAFCYSYEGNFFVVGGIDREPRDEWKNREITINFRVLEKLQDILISKNLLIDPGQKENTIEHEIGPNNSKVVSDMCIIGSKIDQFDLQLACSYKYFNDMGGHWDEYAKEWEVRPHSGNHHFFEGEIDIWFKSLIFINGIKDNTIMGSPLFLIQSIDPNLKI